MYWLFCHLHKHYQLPRLYTKVATSSNILPISNIMIVTSHFRAIFTVKPEAESLANRERESAHTIEFVHSTGSLENGGKDGGEGGQQVYSLKRGKNQPKPNPVSERNRAWNSWPNFCMHLVKRDMIVLFFIVYKKKVYEMNMIWWFLNWKFCLYSFLI